VRRARQRGSGGQASVELVAGALGLMLAALVAFQLLAAGYAAVMADHAAEAAALAVANGADASEAARAAVPAWPSGAARVRRRGGSVYVTLFPPSPFRFLRDRIAVSGRATVRVRDGEPRA
jgi:hypothetical protein